MWKGTKLEGTVVITEGLMRQKVQEWLESVRWELRPGTVLSTKEKGVTRE